MDRKRLDVMRMTGNKEVITGSDFKRMITGAYSEFLLEYENLNQLNASSLSENSHAGTNLVRTMGAAAVALLEAKDEGIGGLSKRCANAAVLGARGNAGVVLAQMFRGIGKGLAGKHHVSSSVFGKAFQYGILYAQRTIPGEEERPIISTARAVAKGAYHAVRSNLPISEILMTAIDAGQKALEKTKDKQVDDVGARAMLVFLNGCLKGLDGNFVSPVLSFASGFKTSFEVPDPKKDLIPSYCLTFSVSESKADPYDVEQVLNAHGVLVVVRKKGGHLEVHLHTDHPGNVIEQALGWGMLHAVRIDNLAEPHPSKPLDHPLRKVAVLALARDAAEAEKLQEYGAALIIEENEGTVIPSVGDFIRAVHSDLAERYIFLPNHADMNLVLEQVQRILGKRIAVLEITSPQEQLQALQAYEEELSLEQAVAAMTAAL